MSYKEADSPSTEPTASTSAILQEDQHRLQPSNCQIDNKISKQDNMSEEAQRQTDGNNNQRRYTTIKQPTILKRRAVSLGANVSANHASSRLDPAHTPLRTTSVYHPAPETVDEYEKPPVPPPHLSIALRRDVRPPTPPPHRSPAYPPPRPPPHLSITVLPVIAVGRRCVSSSHADPTPHARKISDSNSTESHKSDARRNTQFPYAERSSLVGPRTQHNSPKHSDKHKNEVACPDQGKKNSRSSISPTSSLEGKHKNQGVISTPSSPSLGRSKIPSDSNATNLGSPTCFHTPKQPQLMRTSEAKCQNSINTPRSAATLGSPRPLPPIPSPSPTTPISQKGPRPLPPLPSSGGTVTFEVERSIDGYNRWPQANSRSNDSPKSPLFLTTISRPNLGRSAETSTETSGKPPPSSTSPGLSGPVKGKAPYTDFHAALADIPTQKLTSRGKVYGWLGHTSSESCVPYAPVSDKTPATTGPASDRPVSAHTALEAPNQTGFGKLMEGEQFVEYVAGESEDGSDNTRSSANEVLTGLDIYIGNTNVSTDNLNNQGSPDGGLGKMVRRLKHVFPINKKQDVEKSNVLNDVERVLQNPEEMEIMSAASRAELRGRLQEGLREIGLVLELMDLVEGQGE